MGDFVIDVIQAGYDIWNFIVEYVFGILLVSPAEFANGSLWDIVSRVLPVFVAVAVSVYSALLYIGFFYEVSDIKRLQMDDMIKIVIKWAIGIVVIQMFSTIVISLINAGTALMGLVIVPGDLKMAVSEATKTAIQETEWYGQIILCIVAIVIFIMMAISGFGLLMTVYERFVRLMVAIPFGVLAVSAMPLRTGMQMTAGFWKNLVSIILEGAAIIMALSLTTVLINNIPSIAGDDVGFISSVIRMAEATFSMTMCLGIVKGAQNIVRKGLGIE